VLFSSDENERQLREQNQDDNYVDLSPDQDKDKKIIATWLKNPELENDLNDPHVAEHLIKQCYTMKASHLLRAKFMDAGQAFEIA
jgi:hypothetical protein